MSISTRRIAGSSWRCVCIAGVLTLSVVAALAPQAAQAHASVTRAEPGQRAVLKTSPRQISVSFSEPIEPAYSTLSLIDAAGHEPPHGKATVPQDDPKRLVLPIDALGPGRYTVKYRALSMDGHAVTGEYGFSVGPER